MWRLRNSKTRFIFLLLANDFPLSHWQQQLTVDGIFSGLLSQNGEKTAVEETWEGIEQARKKTKLRRLCTT
jgi:hypothetical protein